MRQFLPTMGIPFHSGASLPFCCWLLYCVTGGGGVGAPPIHLHPSIQLCGCTPIFGLSSLAATAKCDSLTEWQRGVIGRGQLVRLCPPSLLANDKYPPPLSHTIITRAQCRSSSYLGRHTFITLVSEKFPRKWETHPVIILVSENFSRKCERHTFITRKQETHIFINLV